MARSGYEIGPHTDAVRKKLTVLYYLPKENDAPENAGAQPVPAEPAIGDISSLVGSQR